MAKLQLDPSAIAKFSVIRIPYRFEGTRSEKLFVILCHRGIHALCIKATSKIGIYKNNPTMMKGCVHYDAGSHDCFPAETVVQPDNQFPIAHADILKADKDGTLEIHAPIANFERELRCAIRDSNTLDQRRRERLLAALG